MKECPACKRCFADDVAHCPQDGEQTTPSLAGEPVLDGRYLLESRLGQGGMGVVYKARHIFLKTAHAIKVILPDLVGNDPNLATRFRQEAMAAANVRHPNIIAVTDFGIVRGNMPFLVMEFVQGESLHDILQREKLLTPARTLELMTAIGGGVAAAHRQNIVHRDLKPLNVMLQDGLPVNEAVRILDFGLAKIKSGEILGSFVAAQTSGLMGSPFYMAPEQWSDEEPDARADIYSLGVMLYQMLAGEVPFKGASIPSIMRKHLTEAPAPMSHLGADIPTEVEAVVRHALEKDPAHRPATVEAFLNELRAAIVGTDDLGGTIIDYGQSTNPDISASTTAFDPHKTQLSSPNIGSVSSGASFPQLDDASYRKIPEAIEAQKLREQAAVLEERARQSAEIQRQDLERLAQEEEARRVALEQENAAKAREAEAIAGAEAARVQAEAARAQAEAARQAEAERTQAELTRQADAARELEEATVVRPPRQSGQVSSPAIPVPAPPAPGELVNFGSTDPGRGPVNTQGIPANEPVVPVQPLLAPPVRPVPFAPIPVRPKAAPAKRSLLKPILAIVAAFALLALGAGGYGVYRYVRRSSRSGRIQHPTTPGPTTDPSPTIAVKEDNPTQYAPNLAVIPGGTFTMGTNDGPPQETPAHAEKVATFSMDKTEVTNGEYAQFVRETGYEAPSHFLNGRPRPGEEAFPVIFVNVADAEAFAAWRSKRDGVEYRLPTEIEWEYAARSGSKNYLYPWGNKWDQARAITKEAGVTGLSNVGSRPEGQDAWGVVDLIGNVREWTSSKVSFYDGNKAIDPDVKQKALDAAVNDRVVRGSSYDAPVKNAYELTATFRDWFPASQRTAYFGFRLVKSGN